jgi:hypothetical protein
VHDPSKWPAKYYFLLFLFLCILFSLFLFYHTFYILVLSPYLFSCPSKGVAFSPTITDVRPTSYLMQAAKARYAIIAQTSNLRIISRSYRNHITIICAQISNSSDGAVGSTRHFCLMCRTHLHYNEVWCLSAGTTYEQVFCIS